MSSKRGSSRAWLREHNSDVYVKEAKEQGYRSRALFKLAEIDSKDKLFKPGVTVVDLGAAPGGWSQYVASKIFPKGRIVALDLLPMEDLDGVEFIQGDFRNEEILEKIMRILDGDGVDIVISDMAPNMSGVRVVDQTRAMYLAELALDAATKLLKPSGVFLVKLFQGVGIEQYQSAAKLMFEKVNIRKPKSSRDRSREFYLLAKGYKSDQQIL